MLDKSKARPVVVSAQGSDVRDAVVTSQTISENARGIPGGGSSPPPKRPRLLPALPPSVLPASSYPQQPAGSAAVQPGGLLPPQGGQVQLPLQGGLPLPAPAAPSGAFLRSGLREVWHKP